MQVRPLSSDNAQEGRALYALRLVLQQGALQPHLDRELRRPARHHEMVQIALIDQVNLSATCRTLSAAADGQRKALFRVQLPVATSRQESLRSGSLYDVSKTAGLPVMPPCPGECRRPPPQKVFAGPLQERVVDARTRVMLPWAAKLRAAQGDKLFAFRFDPWEGICMAGGPEGWPPGLLPWRKLDVQLAGLVDRELRPEPTWDTSLQHSASRTPSLLTGTRWPGLRDDEALARRLALQWAFAVRFGLHINDPLVCRAPNIWRPHRALMVRTLTIEPALAVLALVLASFVVGQLGRPSVNSAALTLALGVGFLGLHPSAAPFVFSRTKRAVGNLAALLSGCRLQDEIFAHFLFYREAPRLDARAFLRMAYPSAPEAEVGVFQPLWPHGSHPSAPGYLAFAA